MIGLRRSREPLKTMLAAECAHWYRPEVYPDGIRCRTPGPSGSRTVSGPPASGRFDRDQRDHQAQRDDGQTGEESASLARSVAVLGARPRPRSDRAGELRSVAWGASAAGSTGLAVIGTATSMGRATGIVCSRAAPARPCASSSGRTSYTGIRRAIRSIGSAVARATAAARNPGGVHHSAGNGCVVMVTYGIWRSSSPHGARKAGSGRDGASESRRSRQLPGRSAPSRCGRA